MKDLYPLHDTHWCEKAHRRHLHHLDWRSLLCHNYRRGLLCHNDWHGLLLNCHCTAHKAGNVSLLGKACRLAAAQTAATGVLLAASGWAAFSEKTQHFSLISHTEQAEAVPS